MGMKVVLPGDCTCMRCNCRTQAYCSSHRALCVPTANSSGYCYMHPQEKDCCSC